MKRFLCLFLLLVSHHFSPPGMAQNEPDYEAGQLFVKVYNQAPEQFPEWRQGQSEAPLADLPGLKELVQRHQIKAIEDAFMTRSEDLDHIYLFLTPSDLDLDPLMEELSGWPFIQYVERVPRYHLFHSPNDLDSLRQWALPHIQAREAWDLTTGNTNIVVAIVDDAILTTHEDLAPRIWTNPGEIPGNGIDDDNNGLIDDVHGYDFGDLDNDPNPPPSAAVSGFSHGTHVAGIAASATNNNAGIASIGYNVSILPIKTKADSTAGQSGLSQTYKGVDYAIAMGADVINMSFGGPGYTEAWQGMINAAYWQGVVFVAGAGNTNNNFIQYPAGYNRVISVGSTSASDRKSSFSSYHASIDVMAPGSNIYSTVATGNGTNYGIMNGTSMASPLTAGLVALLLSVDSTLTPDEVQACLEFGCKNINSLNPQYVGKIGAGRINAFKSVQCALDPSVFLEETTDQDWEISPPAPNPVQESATLLGQFPTGGKLVLELKDLQGRTVENLYEGKVRTGNFTLNWHRDSRLAAGVYLLVWQWNGESQVQRLVLGN